MSDEEWDTPAGAPSGAGARGDRVRTTPSRGIETARHRGGPFPGEERDALFLSSVLDLWGKWLRGRAVAGREAERQERHARQGEEQRCSGVAGEADQRAGAQQPDRDAAAQGA